MKNPVLSVGQYICAGMGFTVDMQHCVSKVTRTKVKIPAVNIE